MVVNISVEYLIDNSSVLISFFVPEAQRRVDERFSVDKMWVYLWVYYKEFLLKCRLNKSASSCDVSYI